MLLLDEPTNDLDTETLTILEDYIASFGGSVITVSHDRYFLNKVAQEYWFIHDGMMERIVGSFEDYETYKKEKDKQLAIEKQATNTSKTQIKERKKTGLSYKEKRIEETEIRLSEIEQEMIEASADYAKIKDLTIEQQQLEQTYDEDITRWSELEELKEV